MLTNFGLLALGLSQFALTVQGSPAVNLLSRADVCQSGVYGELTPYLINYPAAQAFCNDLYKPECTIKKAKRQPSAAPRTTTTTSVTSSATSRASPTTSAAPSTTVKVSTTSSKSSTTTQKQDPKSSALAKLQGQVGSVVKTLCSCIQSHPACTTSSSSTTTTSSTTSSTKSSTTSSTTSTTTSSTTSDTTSSTTTTTTTSTTSATPTPTCNPGPYTDPTGSVWNGQCNFNYFGGQGSTGNENIIAYYSGSSSLNDCITTCSLNFGSLCQAVDFYRAPPASYGPAGGCFCLYGTSFGGSVTDGVDGAVVVA